MWLSWILIINQNQVWRLRVLQWGDPVWSSPLSAGWVDMPWSSNHQNGHTQPLEWTHKKKEKEKKVGLIYFSGLYKAHESLFLAEIDVIENKIFGVFFYGEKNFIN